MTLNGDGIRGVANNTWWPGAWLTVVSRVLSLVFVPVICVYLAFYLQSSYQERRAGLEASRDTANKIQELTDEISDLKDRIAQAYTSGNAVRDFALVNAKIDNLKAEADSNADRIRALEDAR